MRIYHGSNHIIETPIWNGSKPRNDYGPGFYATESIELAKEWACGRGNDGFANAYDFDMDGLNVLRLNEGDYNILNWLAVLAKHRTYWQNGSIAEEAKDYLEAHFAIDLSPYDVIIGYRADDSYFSFAQDFVSNVISLRKLSEAMRLGKLGEQVVLKSKAAFERIRFVSSEIAPADIYYQRKVQRDLEARRQYRFDVKAKKDTIRDLFMIDIMREGIENGDPRLR